MKKNDLKGPPGNSQDLEGFHGLLVKEWEKLREEILARVGIQYRIIITATLTMGGQGLAMATILDRGWYNALVLISLFYFALAALYIEQDRLIARIGMYINWKIRPALERILNVKEGVLGWETFRGRSLSPFKKRIATTLSTIRYLPSLGAGFTSIFIYLKVRCPQWPNTLWEWSLFLVTVLMGFALTFSAYLTHKDYNLIWDNSEKTSAVKQKSSKKSNK
jgi:hypothetical protein